MKIYNNSTDTQNYELMKKSLDVGAVRSKVISYNIANVNNKGFKRYYVEFEDALKEADNEINVKVTNKKHIDINDNLGEVNVKRDTSCSMRQDGNNVDIDLEKVNQAANTLMYNAMISQVNNRLSTKRYIINGR